MLEHVSFTKLPLQILEAGLVVDIKPLERVQSTRGRKGIRFTCCRNLNLPNLPLAQIHVSHFHEILGMSDSETAIKLEGNTFFKLSLAQDVAFRRRMPELEDIGKLKHEEVVRNNFLSGTRAVVLSCC